MLIGRGLAALDRAERLGGALGPYALQAAIAACHARAATADATDGQIAALYEALAQLSPSPVVELNRAVAVGLAYGPAAGLELVDALTDEPALQQLPPAAERPRRPARASSDDGTRRAREFERAATLTRNEREQALLRDRAAACARALDG